MTILFSHKNNMGRTFKVNFRPLYDFCRIYRLCHNMSTIMIYKISKFKQNRRSRFLARIFFRVFWPFFAVQIFQNQNIEKRKKDDSPKYFSTPIYQISVKSVPQGRNAARYRRTDGQTFFVRYIFGIRRKNGIELRFQFKIEKSDDHNTFLLYTPYNRKVNKRYDTVALTFLL